MANPLRAATVWPSVAVLEAATGPATNGAYAVPEDRPILFEWVLGDSTALSSTSLGHTGGSNGRWLARGSAEGIIYDLGTALTDADQTLSYSLGGRWRRQIVALTANRIKRLAASGAVAGNVLLLTREETSAFTLTVKDDVAGTTLWTCAAGIQWVGEAIFDGTNWVKRWCAPQEFIP